ncbi:hypothetical protein DAPPUDRAFT_231855 [Daphnia pulex]|uniref:1-Cys peroxiredoxin n=1 Tax=Daphnia pulex TaxID=6669 RepID=E9HSC7_DAPPU|nr:hypothetical protein DAPPUDRAFT_231855 [Daphnia pulex]|eukprot:EFX65355.1 hypothetical protein DAPPUDRAFT_231855 [Daphnia pulex]
MVNLGDVFPDFEAETTQGHVQFHEWLGDSWGLLFSHPADFTPVCTTELGRFAQLQEKFEERNVKLIALSCDGVESHLKWIEDIRAHFKVDKFTFPIIADEKRELAIQFGMIDPDEKDATGMPLTCRAVFLLGPDKRLKLSLLYPATTGRNFDEILRVIDSVQLTAKYKVATPADWKHGTYCMVLPTVKDEDLAELFPAGVEQHTLPSGKGYLRTTPCPDQ